jgi:hypothetical protein
LIWEKNKAPPKFLTRVLNDKSLLVKILNAIRTCFIKPFELRFFAKMNLPFQPTFNSILMILIGLALIFLGVFFALSPAFRFHSVGFIFAGIGNVLFGFTNGFSDMSPLGLKLYRLALAAYILGIPVIIHFLYRQM